jgi:hypothetical protein
MTNVYNLDREFIKWFYEEPYPQEGSNRCTVALTSTNMSVDVLDNFMRLAYKQGARSVSNETRCILSDWACSVEGLEPELITPSEVFDRAEENLDYYYKDLFGEQNEG